MRGSDPVQRQVLLLLHTQPDYCTLNPLSPHDALKHHFTSLKTDLIFLQLGGLE